MENARLPAGYGGPRADVVLFLSSFDWAEVSVAGS